MNLHLYVADIVWVCHLQEVSSLEGTDALMQCYLCLTWILTCFSPTSPGPCLLCHQVFESVLIRLPRCYLHSSPPCSKPFTDTCQPCSGSSARSSENRLLCRLRPPAFPAVLALWGPFLTPPWRREWLPTPVFLPGELHG